MVAQHDDCRCMRTHSDTHLHTPTHCTTHTYTHTHTHTRVWGSGDVSTARGHRQGAASLHKGNGVNINNTGAKTLNNLHYVLEKEHKNV